MPVNSPLTEAARTSCLRMCLKTLWICVKVYNQSCSVLSSYFSCMYSSPEITRHLHTEPDPVARITGHCFGALIVTKLLAGQSRPISLSGGDRNPGLACILAILGTESEELVSRHKLRIINLRNDPLSKLSLDCLLRYQLRIINLRTVVSAMSGEVDKFAEARMPADLLKIAQDTLNILADDLCGPNERQWWDLLWDQKKVVRKFHLDVVDALPSDESHQFKNETVKTLARLRQILERPLPGVVSSQDTASIDEPGAVSSQDTASIDEPGVVSRIQVIRPRSMIEIQ
ncbi:hypothetical protein EI94DRAFT_1726177 [Lactarius quietus]|nr:hypothetical protein EI94DRAFT_1746557 [Lactarius quietus]KAF8269079.1 hypothetical protein EI94DRAFT_1726177 [Lactarius quietus]